MKKIPLSRSKPWLTGAAAGLAAFSGGERLAGATWVDVSDLPMRRAATLERFAGGYENVLGTSLDLAIKAARLSDAAECELRILGEIERLRRILSTYDPASEISRVMAGAPVESPELAEVLAAYDFWSARTGGLLELNLGGVIEVWRSAARTGRLPDPAALEQAARRERAYNVDALGKGYIIDRAVAVARKYAPGGVINLGGDIRAWGETAWTIGVADPRRPEDNAPPIARFSLREAAVTTSGGYARFYELDGRRYSHLVDPRTRRPIAVGGSATVVAGDSVTANALSTAASIGGLETGSRLARQSGVAGYFLVSATGTVAQGGVFTAAADSAAGSGAPSAPPSAPAKSESTPPAAKAAPAPTVPWPQGFQVSMQVVLKKPEGPPRQIYRPYVAVWIQNARGQVVRTLNVWGGDERWQRKLSAWWNAPGFGGTEPPMTSRATRAPGTYALVWNGMDDFGKPVPAGNYTICLEVAREAGGHTLDRVPLVCGAEPATAAFRETPESNVGAIAYGLPEKPPEKAP